MRNILFIVFWLLTLAQNLMAQTDTPPIRKINKVNENYASYVQVQNQLFALTDSGKLVIWNLKNLDTVRFHYNSRQFKYTAIAKDQFNNIFIATKDGSVFKLDPLSLSYSLYQKIKYPILNILINPDNKIYLIAGGAIYDPQTKKYWYQFENHTKGLIQIKEKRVLFFHLKKHLTKYFANPQYTFVDSKGKFWMTAVYGEFGGEVEVFDSKKDTIVNNRFGDVYPGDLSPRSVFEDDMNNIYVTCGLQHFMNFGEIYRIDNKRNIIKIFNGDIMGKKVFVGPGAFNKINHKIYFVTTNGFYNADITLTDIKPQLIFNTNLSWTREPMAVGVDMSVSRLDFTIDNRLLFLTKNDGFGIYDGKSVTFLK
jgi:hypothetical protein